MISDGFKMPSDMIAMDICSSDFFKQFIMEETGTVIDTWIPDWMIIIGDRVYDLAPERKWWCNNPSQKG